MRIRGTDPIMAAKLAPLARSSATWEGSWFVESAVFTDPATRLVGRMDVDLA
jgi:hypothetical protein